VIWIRQTHQGGTLNICDYKGERSEDTDVHTFSLSLLLCGIVCHIGTLPTRRPSSDETLSLGPLELRAKINLFSSESYPALSGPILDLPLMISRV
jgi:hypothetical protein